MLVWLNGRVLPARAARVSALDRGLLHGDGVYDTWRTYRGEPFAVAAHLKRLGAAARRLRLPSAGAADVWEQRTRLLLRRNKLSDAAVRLTLTRGGSGLDLTPVPRARPTLLLTVRPLPADLAQRQAAGIGVVLLPFPRDAAGLWAGMKLLGHASAVLGRTYASRHRAAEALYVNASGDVTEATTANLFIVEGEVLVTPPLQAGILPGVTRELIIRLARRVKVEVREEPISIVRLRRADEVFLTASTIEVQPVVRLGRQHLGSGEIGPTTYRLQYVYRAHVRRLQERRARRG